MWGRGGTTRYPPVLSLPGDYYPPTPSPYGGLLAGADRTVGRIEKSIDTTRYFCYLPKNAAQSAQKVRETPPEKTRKKTPQTGQKNVRDVSVWCVLFRKYSEIKTQMRKKRVFLTFRKKEAVSTPEIFGKYAGRSFFDGFSIAFAAFYRQTEKNKTILKNSEKFPF